MKINVMKTAAINMVRLLWAGLTIGACMVSADTVVFTKPDSADWALPENQDRITSNVWITRKDIQSLFNIVQEDGYNHINGSPVGTVWSDTVTAAADQTTYTNFVAMHGGGPQSLIGDTVSLYLPQDGLYYDVTFLSYSGGNTGGGFSYSRTSMMLGADKNEAPTEFSLSGNYPNPFNPTTSIRFSKKAHSEIQLRIFDSNGRLLETLIDGPRSSGEHEITWHAGNLPSGTYFMQMKNGGFVKARKMVLLK